MNNQEIFKPEERDENANRKRELVNLVASREAVLIVGAGSSVRVGYPDWDCLLQELESFVVKYGFEPDEGKRENDRLAYVDDIKSYICEQKGNLKRYHALLMRLFGRKTASVDDFHKMLVSLPFRGILTTNYDTVLEAALSKIKQASAYDNSLVIDYESAGQVDEFLRAMTDVGFPRHIAHLHGKYDYPKSIILSRKDYQSAYEGASNLKFPNANQDCRHFEWTLHRKLLWAVLATRRVVSVGFSIDDPYFEEMLETVSEDLWKWDKSTHFAIMDISPERAKHSKAKAVKLKSEYGVGTVFYEDLDCSHQGLDDIVAEIAKKCGVETQPQIGVVEVQPRIEEAELDWLEQMNQLMEGKIDGEN